MKMGIIYRYAMPFPKSSYLNGLSNRFSFSLTGNVDDWKRSLPAIVYSVYTIPALK